MKTYPRFIDLGTSGKSVVSFTPRPLYHPPREKGPRKYCIGGSVGPRAGLNDMER
jgi:hypothetical protein